MSVNGKTYLFSVLILFMLHFQEVAFSVVLLLLCHLVCF